ASILDPLGQPRHQPIMVDPVEEFLQIQIDHPLVSLLQVSNSLGDRRVTAAAGPEAMATRVERRLVVRTEHLVHCLLHEPVNHVRYAKASLAATRLWNPYPAN